MMTYRSFFEPEMSILYDADASLNLFYFAGFGHCTGAEYAAANAEAHADARRRPGARAILDLSRVTALDVLIEDMRQVVARDADAARAGTLGHAHTVLLARHDNDVMLARLYTAMVTLTDRQAPCVRLDVAYTLDDALHLLGLEGHRAEALRLRRCVRERAGVTAA
jgi:hypothetical protein